MTLRKKDEDVQPEFDPAEVMRMEKFTEWIKELAIYLGQFVYGEEKIINIAQYDKYLFPTHPHQHHISDVSYLCVAGGKVSCANAYVKKIIETVFPAWVIVNWPDQDKYGMIWGAPLLYGSGEEKFSQVRNTKDFKLDINCHDNITWRCDITYPGSIGKEFFRVASSRIKNLTYNLSYSDGKGYLKYHNLFWNLFLLALDDDIYNEQLSNVVELAHYLDFDEPMLRDWCRGVEYVLSGKKLSPDCDLECETVEGARFFLHREE